MVRTWVVRLGPGLHTPDICSSHHKPPLSTWDALVYNPGASVDIIPCLVYIAHNQVKQNILQTTSSI